MLSCFSSSISFASGFLWAFTTYPQEIHTLGHKWSDLGLDNFVSERVLVSLLFLDRHMVTSDC